jgi:hypothetical protein
MPFLLDLLGGHERAAIVETGAKLFENRGPAPFTVDPGSCG